MNQITSDPDAAYTFINAQVPVWRTEDWKGIVLTRDDKVIAAVGYDQYNGSNIFVHLASDGSKRWLNRHFLHEGFKYPFVTLGCQRITAWVEACNYDSHRFCRNIGWTVEAVLEKAGRDGRDVLIYRMFRQECRYA